MAEDEIPAELQQKIQELQQKSAQLQALSQQRAQLEMMEREGRHAREALEALADDAQVFRSVGSLMVSDSQEEAVKRLRDEGETLEIRMKRVKGQEESLTADLTSLQDELQAALQA